AIGATVWDVATGAQHVLSAPPNLLCSQLRFVGRERLVAGSYSPNVYVWDLSTGERHALVGSGEEWNVDVASDQKHAVAAGSDGLVRVWDLATTKGRVLGQQKGVVSAVAIAPDSQWVASASEDGTVGLWSLTSDEHALLTGDAGVVAEVAWSPDGRWLASTAADRTVRLWSRAT